MPDPVVRTIRVRCSVTHAFATFTGKLDLWWPPTHRRYPGSALVLDPTPGGRFFERATSGEENDLGQVLTCDPPHSITYTWNPGKISGPTHVDVQFAADGDATIVTVVHSEGAADMGAHWPDRAALFEHGWTAVLAAFTDHIRPKN